MALYISRSKRNYELSSFSSFFSMTLSTPSSLDPAFFQVIPHLDDLSRFMLLQNTNNRYAFAHTKSRSERRGSTRKLTNQKGAGRSRKGSNRSPTRRGGGVAFGPKSNANHHVRMNAQERRLALVSALSLKAHADQVRVLSDISMKTSEMAKTLSSLGGTILFVVDSTEKTTQKGINNLAGSHCDVVTHLNPHSILKYDFCVFTDKALATLSTHFA